MSIPAVASESHLGTYLSEFANVADLLTLQRAEVGGDTTVLEVHNSSERLVKKRPDGEYRKVASFSLFFLLVDEPDPLTRG